MKKLIYKFQLGGGIRNLKSAENIVKLISSKWKRPTSIFNLLESYNGHNIFEMANGRRPFVVVNVPNVGKIPFYMSSKGTDGKIKGKWYPFFGIGDNGNWLIKGSVDKNGEMYYSPEIDKITELLNKELKLPQLEGHNIKNAELPSELVPLTIEEHFNITPELIKYLDDTQGNNITQLTKIYRDGELQKADTLFVKDITGLDGKDVINGQNAMSYIKSITG